MQNGRAGWQVLPEVRRIRQRKFREGRRRRDSSPWVTARVGRLAKGGGDVRAIDGEGNPSRRGSGLRLYRQCGNCGNRFRLSVAQERGRLLLGVEMLVLNLSVEK